MKNSNGEEEDKGEEEQNSHVRGTVNDQELVHSDSVHTVTTMIKPILLLLYRVILV